MNMVAPDFSNLFSALFNCFAIIIFGYIAGRVNIVTPSQSHGLGNFIGYFALPALLLKNMIILDFDSVSWTFMLAIFIAKAIVFICVIAFSLLVLRRKGLGTGGLYAMFATQSNDFALGYPIVKVLYQQSFPELIQYIYLLAPISLLILNPIGMLLLEVDKQWRLKQEAQQHRDSVSSSCELSSTPSACENCPSSGSCLEGNADDSSLAADEPMSRCRLILQSIKSLFLNPIVSMVFIGLIFHFIFKGKIPTLLSLLLTTLGESFSATALFYLGLNMVGKIGKQTGVKLLVPAALIATKILFLPIIAHEMVILLNGWLPVANPHGNGSALIGDLHNNNSLPNYTGYTEVGNMSYVSILSNYAFLYGTFPTAPSVIIYAAKYGLEVDRIATGVVVCTTLSAPIMYVSAWTLTISSMDYQYYKQQVALTDQNISIIGMLCAAWSIAVFICTKKFQRIPHFVTTSLTFAMFLASFTAVIGDFALHKSTPTTEKIVMFYFFYFGVKATRLYAASLALCILIYKFYGDCKVRKLQWFLIFIPILIALLAAGAVVAFGEPMDRSPSNPVFMFGRVQNIVSFTILLVSLLTCVACIIPLFRLPRLFEYDPANNNGNYSGLENRDGYSESSTSVGRETDDDFSDDSSSILDEQDNRWFKHSVGDPQIARHIVLLLFLCISMIIGAVLTGWRLSDYGLSGIYFEIGFLDSVFNFGQAFFVFLIFGLDEELIIDPFVQTWHRFTKGHSEITMDPLHEVDQDILKQCQVFVRYHLDHCKRDLLCSKRLGLQTYNNVVTGSALCSWLVEVGLAIDRKEAILYGQRLMLGRVLQHVTKTHHFYDKNFLYQFETRKRIKTPATKFRSNVSGAGDATGSSSDRSVARCKFGRKQFSFERYLNEDVLSCATTPRHRHGRVTKHLHKTTYDTEFASDDNEPTASGDVMSSVAQSTAEIVGASQNTPWTAPDESTSAAGHSRQDHSDLIDW